MPEAAPYYSEIAQGPTDARAFWIETDDNLRLRACLWSVGSASQGTILLFPGRTEYIELQGRTADRFVALGYSVLTIDWRGHGLSDRLLNDRNTVHVNSYADYQRDVRALVSAAKDMDIPKPWYLLGNSMGGCIGLRAMIEGLTIAASAFTAPMWGIKMSPLQRRIATPVTYAFAKIGRGDAYVPGHDGNNYALTNPFDGNRITHDPVGYDYWVKQARHCPALQTAGSSMTWLHQSLLECRRLAKFSSPPVPCVTFWGEDDGIVDEPAISARMNSWPGGRYQRLPGAKHGLLLEKRDVRDAIIKETSVLFRSTR